MSKLREKLRGDFAIWIILFLLAIFSLLSVYSASGMLAYKVQGGNTSYYLIKHLAFILLSFGVAYGVHMFPYKYWSKLSRPMYLLAIVLLILTYAIGMNLNSASRWIMLPFGFSFQTSDFAKVALLVYLARVLSKRKNEITGFKEAFRIIMLPVLIICGLIFPADFSTAFLLFGSVVVLLFIAQIPGKYIFGMIGVAIAAAALFILIMLAMPNSGRVETWKSRIESFTSGDDESNFQADHSRIAIASGGIIPQGPGKSVQRNILPHPYSDFIFAIIVEEWGLLIGGILLPLLYVVFFSRVVAIVRKAKGSFAAYLVSGLSVVFVFQAFANMLVAVNLMPVTGQTLPFVSMGGSSMMLFAFAVGIILSVSRSLDVEEVKQAMSSDPVKSNDDEE